MIGALGTHSELLASQPRYRDLMSGEAQDTGGQADGQKVAG